MDPTGNVFFWSVVFQCCCRFPHLGSVPVRAREQVFDLGDLEAEGYFVSVKPPWESMQCVRVAKRASGSNAAVAALGCRPFHVLFLGLHIVYTRISPLLGPSKKSLEFRPPKSFASKPHFWRAYALKPSVALKGVSIWLWPPRTRRRQLRSRLP